MGWNLIQDTVWINYLSDLPSFPLRICCGRDSVRVSVSGSYRGSGSSSNRDKVSVRVGIGVRIIDRLALRCHLD